MKSTAYPPRVLGRNFHRSCGILPRNQIELRKWYCLRGAWRDHCFPEPFSWFLHETGLESVKITSARCFLLKCQRKDSKREKEHRQFRGVLGRWRTAAIDRTTFHACQRCRKMAVFRSFFLALGSFGEEKPFVTSNASFWQETRVWAAKTNQTVRWLLSACVQIRFCPEAPASSTVDVNSRFSRFPFSAFWSNGLASSVFIFSSDFVTVFFIVFVYARAKIYRYRFLNFYLRKSYASSKPTG